MANCEICGRKIGGVLGAMPPKQEEIERHRRDGIETPDEICYPCFTSLRGKVEQKRATIFREEKEAKAAELAAILSEVRITTYPPEQDLSHVYCGLVTATAAIGTGPISQILSSWTDFFGEESGTYNEKLRQGEKSCMLKIQRQAIMLGANAVAGARLSYTELTSGHGMLLVCMTGTAINIRTRPQDIKERYLTIRPEESPAI